MQLDDLAKKELAEHAIVATEDSMKIYESKKKQDSPNETTFYMENNNRYYLLVVDFHTNQDDGLNDLNNNAKPIIAFDEKNHSMTFTRRNDTNIMSITLDNTYYLPTNFNDIIRPYVPGTKKRGLNVLHTAGKAPKKEKVRVLGRDRLVKMEGRKKMVTYLGKLIPLSEARAEERRVVKSKKRE